LDDAGFLDLTVFFFFAAGLAFSLAGVSSAGLMPQKEAPKFLITLGEMVGGFAKQPRQFLSLQDEEVDFKPLWISFRCIVLLTFASERGALPLPLPLCFGVTLPCCLGVDAVFEALEVLPSASKSRS